MRTLLRNSRTTDPPRGRPIALQFLFGLGRHTAACALLSTSLLVTCAMSVFAQEVRSLDGEHPLLTRGEIHAIADPVPLRSFKEQCDQANAIIEGVVENDASRLMPGIATHIETDFRVTVGRVIKGSIATPKIVVSEMGGKVGELHLIMNFPLLQKGERYVLFLDADKRPGVPPVPGLPRYEAEIFYGTFKVDAGKIRPFFRDFYGGQYTGLTLDAFAATISAELKP